MATLHTSHFQENTASCTSHTHNLVFIDMAVEDYSNLVKGVLDNTEVFLLDSTQNGVEQITEILANWVDAQRLVFRHSLNLINIHIVCHGAPGCLQLGNRNLGLDTLNEYSQQLQQWQKIFFASTKSNKLSNLLIYGCNVAFGDAGAEFVEKLHQLTGANIAASRQLIGNAALGGNWNLEVRTTDMEVSLAFTETTRKAYAGVLATFIVNNTGDGDDGNPNNGITTLREAINLANATPGNDTIAFGGVFADGTPDVITLTSGQLTISNDITILGTGASKLTVSGNNASRVLEISGIGTDANLDGLKIANGNNTSGGGILVNTNTILTLSNSIVSSNTGSGIYNKGVVSLNKSNVSGNTSDSGGGIQNRAILTLTGSNISGNTANKGGGGIANYNFSFDDGLAILSLNNSTVSGNKAGTQGGGIDSEGNLQVINSTISGNTANNGAGIYNGGDFYYFKIGSATLTNSTVSGNTALEDGGGIYNYSNLSLNNSTITNNTADSNGDGVGNGGGVLSSEGESDSDGVTVTIVGNTIIAGNLDKSTSGDINPDVSGSRFKDSGNNLIGSNTGSNGFTTSTLVGTNASRINPQLGPLQNNGGATLTHALLAGSPAINAGNNSLVSTITDQRGAGYDRISDGVVEIGADEVQSNKSLPVNTDTVVTNTKDSGAGSLRQAILNANTIPGANTITFAGVFTDATPDIITLTSGQLTISDNLTILGTGALNLTISGNNSSGVFEISGSGTDATINGLKIANANDVIYGSILVNSNASLSLTNSSVSDNKGAVGGIFNRGSLSLNNSNISGNKGSSLGGGIFNKGNLSLINSSISNNSAIAKYFNAYGGGIFNTGNLTIAGSTVSNNSAIADGLNRNAPDPYPSYGGGIYNSGTVNLTNSTVSGSIAQSGGGIYNSGIFNLSNSTISGNKADIDGGGIYNSGTLTLTNSTINNNTAKDFYDRNGDGGGIFNYSNGTVNVGNTIIAGNFNKDVGYDPSIVSPDVFGNFSDTGNNLIGDNTGSTGFTTSTLVGTKAKPIDPKLSPLQNNGGATFTNALLADSPAINTGNNTLIPAGITNDQRGAGFDRISTRKVDIGALEFNGLNGTNGADNLVGKNYSDIINAQAGNDTITGNQGNDILSGGGGKDRFVYNLGDGVDTITDFGGLGKGSNPSAAVINELDTLKFQGSGLTARNLLLTQNGNNLEITFEGVADDKVILQNFSLENLHNLPTIGNILFDGQSSISQSFDVFDANSTQSTIFNKNTVTFLNDLNNNVNGFDNSDDVINSQGGNDRIDGKSGNDLLRGGAGKDTLIGGVGNDTLISGAGDDTLTGGSGRDQFIHKTLSYVGDTITDFNQSEDKLVLTEVFKNLGYTGSNPIADGYLQFVQSDASTLVQYPGSDYPYTLATLNNFTATNLVVGVNVIV